jgi:hypothetical protein
MENIKPKHNIETLRETMVVESSSARLNIDAPSFVLNKIISAPDFFYRIPGGKFLKDLNFHEWEIPTLSITVESDVCKQEWRDGILRITYGDHRLTDKDCFEKDKYLERDLVWLALTALEASRQMNGQFLVHASAVEKNGQGVVFFGQTHAGKSLISSTMGFKYGFNIIGTEHTLLGKNGIEGGTHVMEFSKGLKKFLPELPVEDPVGNPWSKENRTSLNLEKINKYSSGAKIAGLVYISIADSDLTMVEWGDRKTLVQMGEWLRWMINSSQTLIHSGKRQMPSLDTLEISEKRMSFIHNLIEEGKRVHFIKGRPDDIAQKIIKEFYE